MKRGHLIKEEISVYFRMVLGRGVAGKERPRMDGKRKTPGTLGGCSAGRAQHPSRKSMETNCNVCIPELTSVRLQATVIQVRIRNFVHKGLKRLYADDATKGVPPDTVDKLRKMFAFLDEMEDLEELRMLPSWKAHTLTGDRKGTWSLSVTANRRLTFRIDTAEREICDVNLEDYH